MTAPIVRSITRIQDQDDANLTLTASEDGFAITWDNANSEFVMAAGGSSTPGGSGTELQYRNGSAFGAVTGSAWDGARLTLPSGVNLVGPATIRPNADSTSAITFQNASGTSDILKINSVNSGAEIVTSGSQDQARGISVFQHINSRSSALVSFFKSRGTSSAPLNGQNGDFLGALAVNPYFNGYPIDISFLMFFMDGNPTSKTNQPVGLAISTGSAQFNYSPTLYCSSDKRVALGPLGGSIVSGLTKPTAIADIASATASSASLRIRPGTAPTTPNDGDIWYDGTNLKIHIGSTTYNFDVTAA